MNSILSKLVDFDGRTLIVLTESLARPIASGDGHDNLTSFDENPFMADLAKRCAHLYRYTYKEKETVNKEGTSSLVARSSDRS